jgi:hypothetical protein
MDNAELDIIQAYIDKRLEELENMINIYDDANMDAPIDLLARRQELERFAERYDEYREVCD